MLLNDIIKNGDSAQNDSAFAQNMSNLINTCENDKKFAGAKRYFLQQWLDEHEQETKGSEWQVVRDQLREWREETAVLPQPFPPPSNQTVDPPPPPLPSPQEYPIVRWKVAGIEETEKKYYIRLLKSLCHSLKEVTVKHEFGAGFSGAKVFLVTRKNANGELLSPIVVKFDKLNKLQEEVNNYLNYINQRFEKCVSLENDILELPQVPYACFAYQLAGGGKFDVESIKSYWRACTSVQEALNPITTLITDWNGAWIEGETKRDFPLLSYDWLLPPNFIIEVEQVSGGSEIATISPDDIFELLASSDYLDAIVCIQPTSSESQSFIVSETDEDKGEVMIDLPSEYRDDRLRIRLRNIENIKQFKVGEAIGSPIYGRIINDRITFLKQIVVRAFNNQLVGLNEEQVILPGLNNLALENPLQQLPTILKTDISSIKVTTVHGDMNLENILIRKGSQGHDISVIDFGKTRKAQNIHDLLRLETNVWLYLIPWRIPHIESSNESALVKQIRKIVSFFKSIHDFGNVSNLHNNEIDLSIPFSILRQIRQHAFDIMAGAQEQKYKNYYLGLCLYMLGALKFSNLDSPENKAPVPKQVAFLVACLAYHTVENRELEVNLIDFSPTPSPNETLPPATDQGENTLKQKTPTSFEEAHPRKFLHDEIDEAFNQDELIELCHEIDVDYENLSGENKKRKAVELVKYCIRHEIINTLIEHCERERPLRDWNNLQF
ncbi:MAG: hypothetical protein H6656_04610 [Ardenticatenaceae bacterium]|nr:hypothetical protein [Ardenticatenaceae bacterium]